METLMDCSSQNIVCADTGDKYVLRDYQVEAVESARRYLTDPRQKKPALIVMPTGCHAKGTPIIMANGYVKPIEEIKIGDFVLGDDGTYRKVLNVHRGTDLMYRIIPVRGDSFVVNKGHILSLISTKERSDSKRIFFCVQKGGEIENISVEEYLKKSNNWKHLRKLYHCNEIEFPYCKQELPIPPYILGLILGDGSVTNGTVGITTMDQEIIDSVRLFADDWNLSLRVSSKSNTKAVSMYFSRKHEGKKNTRIRSRISNTLRRLNIAEKKSEEKFIPLQYKTASRADRLEILAGLLDTDGSLSAGVFDYISKSKKLAKDVAFIARSLGLSVTERECIKTCQTGFSGIFYRLCISGNVDKIPCRITRKQAKPRIQKKNPLVTGFSIEDVGMGEYFGFEITGNHLYLTEDFFVHHNSGKSLIIASIAEQIDEPLIVFQPTKEILEQNYHKMMDYGIMGVTIYSASMNRKEIGNITLATIGSVYRKPDDFKHFKYIIMDEAHLCNSKGGMYKEFFEVVGEKIIGLTATPYRLSHDGFGGSILKFLTRTNPRVFGKVIHVTQTGYLAKQGYFSKVEYYPIKGFNRSEIQLNSTGADYLEDSEKTYYTKSEFNKSVLDVVKRLLKVGKTRILVFTKFVEEADTLSSELGDCAAMVNGDMKPKDRNEIIKNFRAGTIKVVANVGVLTLGFDYPELEVVVIARPTRSLTLYYQMVGRCVRPHPNKQAAWVVDMCGNYDIFGKVEQMRLVEFNDNIWYVMSGNRKLTNVYLSEIMKD